MVTEVRAADTRPLHERSRWERFCHWAFVFVFLLPVALWLWARDQWRRWFGRFEISGHHVTWYLEDGTCLSGSEFIDRCVENGGEEWFFRERWHLQTRWPDGQRVSTVFMGLDHSFSMTGFPRWAVLWETMVFGAYGSGSGSGQRYTRRIDAALGHWKWVAIVQFYRWKAALRREPRLPPPTEGEV